VLAHRLVLDVEAEFAGVTTPDVLDRLLDQVAPPVLRTV